MPNAPLSRNSIDASSARARQSTPHLTSCLARTTSRRSPSAPSPARPTSTVYLHYPSIDSLLTHRAEEIIEHVIDIIREHSEETRKQRIHGILADINKSIVENLGFYEHTAHSLPVNAMIDLMGRSAKPAFAATGVDTHLMDDVEFRMRMSFYLSGALMLYRSWVLSDHSTPIERISELLEETLDTDSLPALNLKSNSEN